MNKNFTSLAFTESVKAVQTANGSRKAYARAETSGDRYRLTDTEVNFIGTRDSFFLGTTGENGWPYVQFRGGPKGFLKVLDEETLGMADFRGNRQYISTGNIQATGRAMLFLIDYPTRERLKIWAETDVLDLESHPELLAKLELHDYSAKIERMMRFRIQAYDWNCQQHITPRYTVEELHAAGIEVSGTVQQELARNHSRFNPF